MKRNKTIRLVYFGDSITYGLGHDHKGVKKSKRWTDLLDYNLKKLEHEGTFIYSSNQGVNGDTTRLALERINDVFKFRPFGKKEFKSTLKSIYGEPAKSSIRRFGLTSLYP